MKITPLEKAHQKSNFSCGHDLLDNYIRKQATQDIKRGLSVCYALAASDNVIMAYYTLSAIAIQCDEFPEAIASKMPPSYKQLPGILLGRLAVDKNFQKQGLGEILLMDAFKKCLDSSERIGSFALVVDPIDQAAANFYQRYGFIRLSTGRMFLPIKTIAASFSM